MPTQGDAARAGELLKQIDPQKGGDRKSEEYQRADAQPLISRQQVAADAGMSPHQAKQAIRVANVPAENFEKQIEPGRGKNQHFTVGGVSKVLTRTEAACQAGMSTGWRRPAGRY